MSAKTIEIRKAISGLLGENFRFFVRHWRDGSITVGPAHSYEDGVSRIEDELLKAGYKTKRNGKPGTAGYYSVDIIECDGDDNY